MSKKSKRDALKMIADSVDKHNKETAKRADIDQATKDRIITNNLAGYEAAKKKLEGES